jgi:hypothetical protein
MPDASEKKIPALTSIEETCIWKTCKRYSKEWQDSNAMALLLTSNYRVTYRHQREGGDFTVAMLYPLPPEDLVESTENEAPPPPGGVYVGATKRHTGGPRFKVPSPCTACFRWKELVDLNPTCPGDAYNPLNGRMKALARAVRNYVDWNDRQMYVEVEEEPAEDTNE